MSEPPFLSVLLEFARLGLISFGGANLAEMERVLVGQRAWITPEVFASGFALGQLMPGPNLLAVTHYGYAMSGPAGAAAATLGFYGPTALLSAALALAWRRLSAHPWLPTFRRALLPFGAGVALAGTLVLAQVTVQSWLGALIALASGLLLWRTRLNAALVVLGAALLGMALGL